MRCVLDGSRIRDIPSFIAELNRAVHDVTGERADFGWDLYSFHDHLFGGYGGSPPYEVVVNNADGMVPAMDHAGLVRYCDDMLRIIAAGGRGMVREDQREWFEALRADAQLRQGRTLLDVLLELISNAPVALTLLSSSGAVLVKPG